MNKIGWLVAIVVAALILFVLACLWVDKKWPDENEDHEETY